MQKCLCRQWGYQEKRQGGAVGSGAYVQAEVWRGSFLHSVHPLSSSSLHIPPSFSSSTYKTRDPVHSNRCKVIGKVRVEGQGGHFTWAPEHSTSFKGNKITFKGNNKILSLGLLWGTDILPSPQFWTPRVGMSAQAQWQGTCHHHPPHPQWLFLRRKCYPRVPEGTLACT